MARKIFQTKIYPINFLNFAARFGEVGEWLKPAVC